MAKDHPCGRGYTSCAESPVKSFCVPKNKSKILGILGIFFPPHMFYKVISVFGKPHHSFKVITL